MRAVAIVWIMMAAAFVLMMNVAEPAEAAPGYEMRITDNNRNQS